MHLGTQIAEAQEEPSTKKNEFAKESHPENDLDHDAKEEKTGGEARERADACACAFGLTAAHAC